MMIWISRWSLQAIEIVIGRGRAEGFSFVCGYVRVCVTDCVGVMIVSLMSGDQGSGDAVTPTGCGHC